MTYTLEIESPAGNLSRLPVDSHLFDSLLSDAVISNYPVTQTGNQFAIELPGGPRAVLTRQA